MASAKDAHVYPTITLREAIKKCSERHSCFCRVESTEHMSLAPCHLGRLSEGVKEELNNRLMKYSDVLQAVPVGYEGIQILQNKGAIIDDSPFIHFDYKVKLIVFKPAVGCPLFGVVNKIGLDHIGCLVHGCFNASISKSNFVRPHDYESLEIGSSCKFIVTGIETANGVLSISGRMDGGSKHNRKRKHKDSEDSGNLCSEISQNFNHKGTTEKNNTEGLNGFSESQVMSGKV